jgi:hypothetical protein
VRFKEQPVIAVREMKAVNFEKRMNHIHALCGHNAEFSSVATGGMYSYHWAQNGYPKETNM